MTCLTLMLCMKEQHSPPLTCTHGRGVDSGDVDWVCNSGVGNSAAVSLIIIMLD